MTTLIWNGPLTMAETRDAATGEVLSFSLIPGAPLPSEFTPDSPQVRDWKAFGLVEERPIEPQTADSKKPNRKEPQNG